MAGKDVRRHAARDQFTRNRRQHDVASRASRERDRSRVETEASDNLAQLASDSVALDEKDIGRGSQAFVARNQDPVVRTSNLQKVGAGKRGVRNDVRTEQSQPSRQSQQHPVNGESGSFIHRDGL